MSPGAARFNTVAKTGTFGGRDRFGWNVGLDEGGNVD